MIPKPKISDKTWITIFCTFIFSMIFILLVQYCQNDLPYQQYRQGQIDALTGKVKYELVMHDDSTRTWKWINREETK